MASFKFVQKLWILNSKVLEKIKNNNEGDESENLTKFTNQLIYKITQNLEKFHYNVIVANLYEMYNFLIKEIDKPIKKEVLIENYRKILILVVKRDINEKDVLKEIRLNKETEKLIKDQKILKTIFVSNRLINIIL